MIGHGRKSWQVVEKIGGASRDRTDDLIVANDALSQLSYSPTGRLDRWLADFSSVCFPAPSARIDPQAPQAQSYLTKSAGSRLTNYRSKRVRAPAYDQTARCCLYPIPISELNA